MTAPVSFGVGVPDDTVLHLCGDVGGGRRVLELGVSDARNSLIVAQAGGKAIAVDPDPTRLAEVRDAAHAAELYVECFEADIADLGFATSASMELVIADHTLAGVSDLPRLARQVHRVLRQSAAFVMSVDHPFAAVAADPSVAYGAKAPTIGDWFTLFERVNFRVDRLYELGVGDGSPVPTTLVVRARKEGS